MLVLGAGGILGEAWMSAVLAGMEDADPSFDARGCRGLVGTSAGSIVAAALAGGVRPSARAGRLPEQPPVDAGANGGDAAGAEADLGGLGRGGSARAAAVIRRGVASAFTLGGSAAAPLASVALTSSAAGGALLRRTALGRIPRGRTALGSLRSEMQRLGVEWDGRLRITAVEIESGRRVVFGGPEAPAVAVADAVIASCAIPGVFRPLRAGGRSYVDGGAWSLTNMDAADVRKGDRVLCLNPTASVRPALTAPAAAIAPWSRTVAAAEAAVLRRRGAAVDVVNPDRGSAASMGSNFMDPGPRERVVAAGFEQGRRLAGAVSRDRHTPEPNL